MRSLVWDSSHITGGKIRYSSGKDEMRFGAMYGTSNDGNITIVAAYGNGDYDFHATYGDRNHTVMTVGATMRMNVTMVMVDSFAVGDDKGDRDEKKTVFTRTDTVSKETMAQKRRT